MSKLVIIIMYLISTYCVSNHVLGGDRKSMVVSQAAVASTRACVKALKQKWAPNSH